MGLRKVLLAFALMLTMVTPAEAFEPCYLRGRVVYAITAEGGLVAYNLCLDPNRATGLSRWTAEGVLATSGWGDVTTAFWSGEENTPGVTYRVVGSDLFWSSDFEIWQRIGAGTDWSAYTSLTSGEPGVIYGTEPSGAVHRWVHTDWEGGSDTWGQETVAATMPRGSVLYGHTRAGFIANTGTVGIWSDTFVKSKARLTIPEGVDPASVEPFDLAQRYPNSAFALTSSGGKLVVMLPGPCTKLERPWTAGDEIGGGYTYVFAGGYTKPRGSGPVEWQCDSPVGPSN
ncbi:hypothetical protein [Lentzea sp. NPDC051838]|uniref:hypothetical protein n=1 Tax=Lentzea sp. NPDC051838 TaxID=3154849 RepID=UPI00341E1C76